MTALADRYDCFLLDLDGVLYRADDPIAGAGDVTAWLREQGKRLAFVTNNSSKTPQQVADKLDRMGIEASPGEVVTSALSTASLLARWGVRRAYVIGETGIRSALEDAGIEIVDGGADHADAVVVGWDRGVTYDRLREAALLVQRGARLVATNGDASYPAPDGKWPGAGAILAAITTTIGRPADAEVGKPHRPLFESALEQAGGGRPLVVGDRIDTDIAGAAALGWDSLLVLTGVATPADLVRARHLPTHVARDLSALTQAAPPSVRPAAVADVEAIERLLRMSGLDAEDVPDRLLETLVAATESGEVVGTCALELFDSIAHLRSLAVDPSTRRAQVGMALCAHATRAAADRGAEKVFGVTEGATGFFEALGFERTGTRETLPGPIAETPLIRDRCTDQAVVFRLDLSGPAGD